MSMPPSPRQLQSGQLTVKTSSKPNNNSRRGGNRESRIKESVTLGREKRREEREGEERRARTMITDFARGGEKTEAD